MNMSSTAGVAVVAIGLVFLTFAGQCSGALEVGFYQGKCGRFVDVEGIVAGVVKTKFFRDRTIAAALIRMQFHDCFVNVSLSFFFFYSKTKVYTLFEPHLLITYIICMVSVYEWDSLL